MGIPAEHVEQRVFAHHIAKPRTPEKRYAAAIATVPNDGRTVRISGILIEAILGGGVRKFALDARDDPPEAEVVAGATAI